MLAMTHISYLYSLGSAPRHWKGVQSQRPQALSIRMSDRYAFEQGDRDGSGVIRPVVLAWDGILGGNQGLGYLIWALLQARAPYPRIGNGKSVLCMIGTTSLLSTGNT